MDHASILDYIENINGVHMIKNGLEKLTMEEKTLPKP